MMKIIQVRTTQPITYHKILGYSYPHRVAFIQGTDPKVTSVASKYLRNIQYLELGDVTPVKQENEATCDLANYSGIFISTVEWGRTYMFELKAHNIKELVESVREFIIEINQMENMVLPF